MVEGRNNPFQTLHLVNLLFHIQPIRLHVSNVFGAALPGAVTVRVEKVTLGDKVVHSANTATKVAGDK